jgi:hypothetical protein
VTVILRSCVKQASEIDNFVSECGAYGAGVSFTLTSKQDGTAHTVKTGNDSTSKFAGLADGAYSLEQVSGDWCKAQAEHVDSSGNVLVQNGGNTNVYIYNCGVKEINTLPATGTGPAGTSGNLPSWWIAALLGLATVISVGLRRATRRPAPARVKSRQ